MSHVSQESGSSRSFQLWLKEGDRELKARHRVPQRQGPGRAAGLRPAKGWVWHLQGTAQGCRKVRYLLDKKPPSTGNRSPLPTKEAAGPWAVPERSNRSVLTPPVLRS